MGPTDKPHIPKPSEFDNKAGPESAGTGDSDSEGNEKTKKGLFRGRRIFRKDNEQKPTARFYGANGESEGDIQGKSKFYINENSNDVTVKKNASPVLKRKQRISGDGSQDSIVVCANAVKQARLLSLDEFYGIGGEPESIGDEGYRHLGNKLSEFLTSHSSLDSRSRSSERLAGLLTLREKALTFVESQSVVKVKSNKTTQSKINAANSLIFVIDKCFFNSKRETGQILYDSLCQDTTNNKREALLKPIFRQPDLVYKIVSQMRLVDLLRFAEASSLIKHGDVGVARAFIKGACNVLETLSSQDIKDQFDLFDSLKQRGGGEYKVSGNLAFDRSQVFQELSNLFNTSENTEDVSAALYQCYQSGFLSMNMLDEMTELKSSAIGRNFADPELAGKQIATLERDFKRQKMSSLEICKSLPALLKRYKKKPDSLMDSQLHTGVFLKAGQLAIMLAGDQSGKDSDYRHFVREWDQIRFKVMPEYNLLHGKDDLVDTLVLSQETSKITPQWLRSFEGTQGDPGKIKELLNEAGWRKAPDDISFKSQLKQAGSQEVKARLKTLACQDCLFRYFSKRAGFEPSTLSPDPQRSSKPKLRPVVPEKPTRLKHMASADQTNYLPESSSIKQEGVVGKEGGIVKPIPPSKPKGIQRKGKARPSKG